MHRANPDCARLIRTGAPLQGDADISGIGVVLAFTLSAYITLITALIAYLLGLIDDELLTLVDSRIFRIRPRARRHPRAYKIILRAVITLGDQQIVTGIAILIAGFYGLGIRKISVYHFQIVLYLAWMSSSVHLSALTVLGEYFKRHRGLMIWRLAGMLILLVLLFVGLTPSISNDWGIFSSHPMPQNNTGWGIPAICFWGRLWGDGASPDAVIGLLILFVSYGWRVGALFSPVRQWCNFALRYPLEDLVSYLLIRSGSQYSKKKSLLWRWVFRVSLSLSLPILVCLEVSVSFAAALWLSLLGLVFGTMQVAIPRNQVLALTGFMERSWSFGQLVPLILLIQPIGAVCEQLWMTEQEPEQRNHSTYDFDEDSPQIDSPQVDRLSRDNFETLLQFMSKQGSIKMPQPQRRKVKEILYASRLFALLVWFAQIAIIAISVTIFTYDAATIGYTRVGDWPSTLTVFGASIVTAVLLTLIISPWSSLG